MWVVWLPAIPPNRAGVVRPERNLFHDLLALCSVAERQNPTSPLHGAAIQAIITGCDAAWQQSPVAPPRPALHPAVAAAIAILDSSRGQIDLATIAVRTGLGLSRLSHRFSEELGTTLAAYRSACRIQEFARLRLQHPHWSLAAVAKEVGFDSYVQCWRAHRTILGQGPTGEGRGRVCGSAAGVEATQS